MRPKLRLAPSRCCNVDDLVTDCLFFFLEGHALVFAPHCRTDIFSKNCYVPALGRLRLHRLLGPCRESLLGFLRAEHPLVHTQSSHEDDLCQIIRITSLRPRTFDLRWVALPPDHDSSAPDSPPSRRDPVSVFVMRLDFARSRCTAPSVNFAPVIDTLLPNPALIRSSPQHYGLCGLAEVSAFWPRAPDQI